MNKVFYLIVIFILTSGCTQKVQKFNQSGHLKFLLQEYTEAIANYTKVLEIDLRNSEAYFGRGLSNANLNRYSEAIADFTKIIEINHKDVEAYRYRGYAKYYLSDFRGAIDDFSNVIKIDSNDDLIYFTRIDAKRKLKDYKGVIEDFTKIIEFNPNKAESYINRGDMEYESNYFPEAISDYIKAIEINNKSALTISQNIGINNKFDYNDDYYTILSDFININHNNLAAYLLRGIAKLSAYNNRISYAIADFNKAIEIDPINSTAYTLRGYAKHFYWKQERNKLETKRSDFMNFNNSFSVYGSDKAYENSDFKRYQEVIADYDQALVIDPKCVAADHLKAEFFKEYNRSSSYRSYENSVIDDALDRIESEDSKTYLYIVKKSNNQIGGLSIDEINRWKKEYEEMKIETIEQLSTIRLKDTIGVVADFAKVIKSNPNFKYSYYLRGAEKIRLQYFSAMISKYDEAIVDDPKDREAYFSRGNLKYYLQDYSGAIAEYTKVIQLDPKNVEAYYNRTCAKYNLQDYRGVLADFTKIIEINPKNAEAYYKRGLLLVLELGEKDSGCMDFSKAGGLGFAKAYEAIRKHCQLQ